MRWLTEYQRGSIFGAILVGVAFAAALSVVPRPVDHPSDSQTSQQPKSASAQHQRDETWWQWTTTDPVATYTLGLCFIAFIQAGLFVWQLGYMREGLKDAATGARAAEDAANAATNLNNITHDAYVVDQRAWVSARLSPCDDFVMYPNGMFNITVDFTIRNHGRTPATRVFTKMTIVPTDDDVTPEQQRMVEDIFSDKYDRGGLTLFPGERFVSQSTVYKSDTEGLTFSPHKLWDGQLAYSMRIVGVTGYNYATNKKGITRFAIHLSSVRVGLSGGGMVVADAFGGNVEKDSLIFKRLNVGNDAE